MNIAIAKLKKIIDANKAVLLAAFLVGLIYLAPHIFFIFSSKTDYSGILFTPADAEINYLSRVREIAEGHKYYHSTYLAEYKDVASPIVQYGEVLFGRIIAFLNIPLKAAYLAAKFLLAMLNYLLWFYFVFLLSANKKTALLSATMFFMAYRLFSSFKLNSLWLVLIAKESSWPLLVYGRFLNPSFSYPFFILGLILLLILYQKPNTKIAVLFAFVLGINFYIYFYFWVFLFVLACFIALQKLLKKQWLDLKFLLLALLGALIIGYYYLQNMFKIAFDGAIEKMSSDSLSYYTSTHDFIFSKIIIGGFSFFILFLLFKKYQQEKIKSSDIFIVLMYLTAIAVVNQQVLSGKLVEEGHFHWYTNTPILFLSFSVIFYYALEKLKEKKYRNFVYYIFMLLFFYTGIMTQVSGYRRASGTFIGMQKYGVAIEWLNENTKKEEVVLANKQLSVLLPAYTHNNVYFAPNYIIHSPVVPLDRKMHSAYVYNYLDNGRDRRDSLENNKNLFDYFKSFVYFKYNYTDKYSYPTELWEKLEAGEDNFFSNSFYERLKEYRLDYIIWDKGTEPEWGIDKLDFLTKIFDYENIYLYKIKNKI